MLNIFCDKGPIKDEDLCLNRESFCTSYKEVWFLFVFSHMTYLASWSSILCLVVSGMVKSPEKMPMAVWISTIGLLCLYQTFVWSQANVIYVRFSELAKRGLHMPIHEIPGFLQEISSIDTLSYRSLRFGTWEKVVLVAMSISSDLILAALYSVKPIRSFFEMPPSNRSEPWSLLVFLYFSSAVTLSIARFVPHIAKQFQKRISPVIDPVAGISHSVVILFSFVAYLMWNIGWFFVWGFAVMSNLHDSQEFGWKATAIGVPLLSFALRVRSSRNYLRKAPRETEETEETALRKYAKEHKAAAICHLFVAAFIVLLVEIYDLGMNDGFRTYSFNLHREQMSVETDGSPIQVQYCARRNSLPVQRWWCAVAWCLASSAQHWSSYNKLQKLESNSPIPMALTGNSTSYRFAALVGGMSVAYSFHTRMNLLGLVTMTLTVTTLILVFAFVTSDGPFVTRSKPRSTEQISELRSISRAKWTEYAASATLMHVVVNSIAGVINAHELVLLCGYMVVSMVLVRRTEDVMERIESRFQKYPPSVHIVIDYERPFVALSFFAKLALTMAITVPVAFDSATDRWVVAMESLWCPLSSD